MARVAVQTYSLQWNPRSNIGQVIIVVGGRQVALTIETVDEFTTTMMLLSKPGVLWDTDQMDFELAFRPVGT